MDLEDLRVAIYTSFAETGLAPDDAQLAEQLGASEAEVTQGMRELADARHLALDDDGAILMAHPFATIPLGYSVMGKDTLWWGGCAWDSFALPHLIPDQAPVLVATRCPNCHRPLAWDVGTEAPPAGDEMAHFLVPSAHMWDDVVHTCSHQNLFCSESCIDDWLERTGNERGYVMDLPTLWNFAKGWYAGRLDHGYVRREPSAAKDYLRSVGLHGPFWGLDD
ncbi:alkylmercury lyase [Knoellia sinensis KCTC 19936]|uniref:Alkylmercury lyase n=1 Tax=Knoellia sinensis KCTC 19936 TaxID=1385520 RepID=A0A0A0J5T3_9MICO|nr:organomercurial lyase [Knoellia sinensis]KGN32124.1 alkylmercury lyase [Knoellia sinensis KCTC 19936]